MSTLSKEQIGGGNGVAEDGKTLREGGKWQGKNGGGWQMHVGKSFSMSNFMLRWRSVVGVTLSRREHEARHSGAANKPLELMIVIIQFII